MKGLILRFFVLVPVIGLAAGFIITRFLLIPNIFNGEKAIPQDVVETTSYIYTDIRPKKYFAVQIGVFREKDNAETFLERLRISGFPGYENTEEEYIRVLSYGSNSGNFIMKKMEDLKALSFDTLQKEINIDIDNVPEDLKKNHGFIKAGRIINSLGDTIDNYCELLYQYESGVIDDNILRDKYIQLSMDIHAETGFKNLTKDDGNGRYSGILECFKAFCLLMEDTPQGIVEHQEKLIEAIYLFRKTVDNLNKIIKG